MKTFTWQFGEIHVQVQMPDELAGKLKRDDRVLEPIDIGVSIHPGTVQQFEAAVEAAGGVTAFNDIDPTGTYPHVTVPDTPAVEEAHIEARGERAVRAGVTVWGPDETRKPVPAEDPLMAEYRDRQRAEREAAEPEAAEAEVAPAETA